MQRDHIQINRRQLLKGDLRGARAPRRPPWALAEASFLERCSRCTDCITACPDQLLRRGSGGYPEIDFSVGGCSFCGACAAACTEGALDSRDLSPTAAWNLRAAVRDECLSSRGIVCRACTDICEPHAIRFQLATGGRAIPKILVGICTGCGACLAVCPIGAIQLEPVEWAEDPV